MICEGSGSPGVKFINKTQSRSIHSHTAVYLIDAVWYNHKLLFLYYIIKYAHHAMHRFPSCAVHCLSFYTTKPSQPSVKWITLHALAMKLHHTCPSWRQQHIHSHTYGVSHLQCLPQCYITRVRVIEKITPPKYGATHNHQVTLEDHHAKFGR